MAGAGRSWQPPRSISCRDAQRLEPNPFQERDPRMAARISPCVLAAVLAAWFASATPAQWSIRASDDRLREPPHLFQEFTDAEWNAYRGAPESSIEKFRAGRYGLFIHYGLSSFRGADLSWSRESHAFPDPGKGTIPDEEYEGFAAVFRMERFDPAAWARMARRAGMKYVVVVAKHHDGFHMWDTAHSDFKITNSPFARDYIRQLSEAFRKEGLAFGVYYSQRDWHHPDYSPLDPATVVPLPKAPFWKPLRGSAWRYAPRHDRYIAYMHATVRELMTGYGKIDILWWDALWWGGMYRAPMWRSAEIEDAVRQLQPEILINNRASLRGDFDTPEQRLGMFQDDRPWESCISLGPHWAWSPGAVKSKRELIRLLVGTAAGDGNLLISVGARPDGTFDPDHVARLLEVGNWLERFGHTVYGTRGGPWQPGEWGGSTQSGERVFVHVLRWPDASVRLPDLGRGIAGSRLLSGEGIVHVSRDNGELQITVPERFRDPIDTIIELRLETARP